MKRYSIFFCLLINLLSTFSVSATSLLPLTLEQLSTRATLIFHGEVINNEVKEDKQSGQIATFTTFRVIELIKGNSAGTHTIKQIGGHLKESKMALRVHGVPEFTTGYRYVVFLPEKSRLGFSSPLGLHQGSFSVITVDDEETVTNGRNMAGQTLTAQLPLAVNTEKPAQSRINDFINTVRAFNAQ